MAAENLLFTPEAKTNFLTHFDNIDEENKKKLPPILIQAALRMYKFPEPIAGDIEGFQHSLERHSQNKIISDCQKECIREYFETIGTEKFLETTQSIDKRWSSPLLKFLSDKLKLEIEEEPIIEAKIKKNGKVAWHSINPITGKPIVGGLKSKRCSEFKYSKAKCWRMTVADFRKFKDSGKRWGNQAITRERFIESCGENYNKLHAAEVWDELKAIGLLNKNDRLSMQWRLLSNKNVTLDTISNSEKIFTCAEIMEALKNIGGSNASNNRNPVTKNAFTNYWKPFYQEEAAHIWEILKRKKMLDEQNRPRYSWINGCSNSIEARHLTYSRTCSTLYKIANTQNPGEHFRPERTYRKWTGKKGLVQNNFQTEGQKDRVLDVGIHAELEIYEVTGDKTEHDHNTSDALLAHHKEAKVIELINLIDQTKSLIEEYEEELNSTDGEEETEDLQDEIDEQNKILVATKKELHRIKDESGANWWTIELPEERHHRGLTYQVKLERQREIIKNPFLDETNHYLDETKSTELYVEEIGAFRTLYRSQRKEHQPIQGPSPIGHFPFLFFQDRPKLSAKISGMFNTRIQEHVEKSEGHSVKRELFPPNPKK